MRTKDDNKIIFVRNCNFVRIIFYVFVFSGAVNYILSFRAFFSYDVLKLHFVLL